MAQYVKQLLERDIAEKKKMNRLQILILIIGVLLILSIVFSTYFMVDFIHEILQNREETLKNRKVSEEILKLLKNGK